MFSSKYNKNFCAIVVHSASYSNSNKMGDLLERLSLKSRVICHPGDLEKKLDEPIDYTQTNKIIEDKVRCGINYLKKYITEK